MQIPKNVIQTGETDLNHKIYIEDYVHTLFMQYKEKEADFCLYGRKETEGDISYYFLYGAAVEESGWEIMENRYFPDQKRIGEATFSEKEKWLFFEDGYASALDGYFIFYEQNEDMQSYLIAMHQNRPGEKSVEVRPRAGRKTEGDIHAKVSSEIEKEPRRIRRSPVVYDLKQNGADEEETKREWQEPEKALHAAQSRPGRRKRESSFRNGSGRREHPASFPGKTAGIAALLVLCAIGITTLGGYQDMEEVGNFFAEAVNELHGREPQEAGLIVEERQIGTQQAAGDGQAETIPVWAMESGTQEMMESLETDESKTAEEQGQEEGMQPDQTQDAASQSDEAERQTQPAGAQETAEDAATGDEAQNAEAQESVSQEPEVQTNDAPKESTDAEEMPADASPVSMTSYVVQAGDTLAAICRRQYGNIDRMDEIVALNGIADPNHLEPGQKIILPN